MNDAIQSLDLMRDVVELVSLPKRAKPGVLSHTVLDQAYERVKAALVEGEKSNGNAGVSGGARRSGAKRTANGATRGKSNGPTNDSVAGNGGGANGGKRTRRAQPEKGTKGSAKRA